jgi:type III secretory pathway component EscV
MPTSPPRLTVRGPDAEVDPTGVSAVHKALQDHVFRQRGILIPLLVWEHDAEAPSNRFELQLDGRSLAYYHNEGDLEVIFTAMTADLAAHAEAFVVSQLVEWYLYQLADVSPDLVQTVRRTFTIEDLTAALGAHVKAGGRLNDLRGTLEELLRARHSGVAT